MYPSMLNPSGDLFADFAQLQDRLDALLGGTSGSSSIRAVARTGAFPAINVGTWAEALEVYAFAPGIDTATLDVSVERGLLTIAGERRASAAKGDEREHVYARERFDGRFRRVVSLPEDADPSRVEASYQGGVLKIVVPRLESAKPRQVAINR
ncbi:MAG: Hsp20/alpha crystallin family protein [Caldimonas sp.]